MAAGQAQGLDVRTIEGLAPGGVLSAVQRAFLEAGAVQCGFCTPGLLIAAHDLIERQPAPSDAEIGRLAGNLCRCTGYEKSWKMAKHHYMRPHESGNLKIARRLLELGV